jgi:hypothetical protein
MASVARETRSVASRLGRTQTITFVPGSFDVQLDIGGQRLAAMNTAVVGVNTMAGLNRPALAGVNVAAGANVMAPLNRPAMTGGNALGRLNAAGRMAAAGRTVASGANSPGRLNSMGRLPGGHR